MRAILFRIHIYRAHSCSVFAYLGEKMKSPLQLSKTADLMLAALGAPLLLLGPYLTKYIEIEYQIILFRDPFGNLGFTWRTTLPKIHPQMLRE